MVRGFAWKLTWRENISHELTEATVAAWRSGICQTIIQEWWRLFTSTLYKMKDSWQIITVWLEKLNKWINGISFSMRNIKILYSTNRKNADCLGGKKFSELKEKPKQCYWEMGQKVSTRHETWIKCLLHEKRHLNVYCLFPRVYVWRRDRIRWKRDLEHPDHLESFFLPIGMPIKKIRGRF